MAPCSCTVDDSAYRPGNSKFVVSHSVREAAPVRGEIAVARSSRTGSAGRAGRLLALVKAISGSHFARRNGADVDLLTLTPNAGGV
jgi:hypothetical protein